MERKNAQNNERRARQRNVNDNPEQQSQRKYRMKGQELKNKVSGIKTWLDE